MGVASQIIFFFIMGAIVLGILFVHPEPYKMLFGFAVAITPWQGGLWIPALSLDLRFSYLIYGLCVFLSLLKNNPRSLQRRMELSIALPTLGMILSACLACRNAIDPPSAWGGVFMLAINYLVFFAVVDIVQKPSDLKYIFFPLLISLVFQSVLGLIQYKFSWFQLGIIDQSQSRMWWRAKGTFFHANHFGMYLTLTIPIIFRLYLLYDTHKNNMIKLYYLIGVILGIVALLASRNRGSWIGLICGTILVFTYDLAKNRSKMRNRYIKLIIPGMLLLFALTLRFGDMLMTRLFKDDASFQIQGRMELQKEAIALIKVNPMGVGLRNYRTHISHEFVHNLYLLIASEAGVMALVFFLILLGVLFYKIVRCTRVAVVSVNNLALAIMASFFAFLLASMAGPDYLIDHSVGMSFWVMAGLMVALSRMSDQILKARSLKNRGNFGEVQST